MNRPVAANGGLPPVEAGSVTAAPAAVGRHAVRNNSSMLFRVLLFVVVAVNLGRLHDLIPAISRLPIGKVLLPLGWLALLAQPGLSRRFGVLRSTQARMFGLLTLAMVISVPFSLYRSDSLYNLRMFLQGTVPLVLLIAVACTDERDLFGVARAVVITEALLGLALLAGMARVEQGRMSMGATYDANDLALVGVVVLPFAVWMMRERSWIWRWIGVAGGAGALATIMMSASRGGMLGLGAVVLLMAVRFSRRIPLQWKIVSVLLLVVALKFAPSSFWERFETLKDPSADYNTQAETGRVALWKRGFSYFVHRPLTGVGLAQFGTAEGAWAQATYGTMAGFKWSVAHSIWIQVLAEIGLLGIVGFLGLYLPTMRDIRRLRLRTSSRAPPHKELQAFGEALGIAIIGFFVSGTFLAMAYSPPAMILAAIGMSYSRISSQAMARTSPNGRTLRRAVGSANLRHRPTI